MKSIASTSLKSKVLFGLFWRFLERAGTQAVQFVVSIILARLLMPEDFGIIGLLTVFIAVAGVFVQSGFGTALIQKRDISQADYSSVFFLSLSISGAVYIVLYNAAPFIASFYTEPLLIPILRVMALSLIIGSIGSIHNAILSREMKFKRSFLVNLGGVWTSAAVGISMAYYGYGIWSLVYSQLTAQVVSVILLWLTVPWRPSFIFSIYRLQELFKFSSKLLFSALLDTIFNNIYPLIIGKLFDRSTLGHYNRGQSIPSLIIDNINGTISGVMFPALASCQNDRIRLKELVRRMIATSSFFVMPSMFGLAVVAEPLVTILLTEKWLPCVPFLQLSCIRYAFWPVHVGNLQAILAIGRSDIFLKLEIIKKTLTIFVIVLSAPFGVYAMVASSAVLSAVCTVINAWPNRNLLDYTYQEQLKDIVPSILLAAAMSIVIMAIPTLQLGVGFTLMLQIVIGASFYMTGAYFLRFECMFYILNNIKSSFSFRFSRSNN